jgi:hypothetical protein
MCEVAAYVLGDRASVSVRCTDIRVCHTCVHTGSRAQLAFCQKYGALSLLLHMSSYGDAAAARNTCPMFHFMKLRRCVCPNWRHAVYTQPSHLFLFVMNFLAVSFKWRRWDSSVNIVTRLRARWLRYYGSIPRRDKDCIALHIETPNLR